MIAAGRIHVKHYSHSDSNMKLWEIERLLLLECFGWMQEKVGSYDSYEAQDVYNQPMYLFRSVRIKRI